MGLGAWIWVTDKGRPLGMSRDSEARLREERCSREDEWREELLLLDFDDDDDLEDDLDDDLWDEEPAGTSRMFSSRPVVGSVVDWTLGLCATW
jgi:hypothetical protein